MNWKNDRWRLILFLILIISGMLKILGSKHSGSGRTEFMQSIQYSKNSFIDRKKVNKDADKFVSIFIKIPTNTEAIGTLFISVVDHF
jgi:hypothetical protein